jgi:hypothetical protein
MDDADYWLPRWWDDVGDGSNPSPPGLPTAGQLAAAAQQPPTAQQIAIDVGPPDDPPDFGGGPPPAAGAAVAVDDETLAEVRRIKEASERHRRVIGR